MHSRTTYINPMTLNSEHNEERTENPTLITSFKENCQTLYLFNPLWFNIIISYLIISSLSPKLIFQMIPLFWLYFSISPHPKCIKWVSMLFSKKLLEVSVERVGGWGCEGKVFLSVKEICLYCNKLFLALFWYHFVL